MPPVSRFGGGGRTQKKKGVIEKLKAFFEKYFGLGIAEYKAEKQDKIVVYETEASYKLTAAEGSAPFGVKVD